MKYGLPYKGSKNKLAERIINLLPDGEHLIDLFCGGCAVTHYALLCGKYPHIHINDIDWRPVSLFEDALAGKYNQEQRWISREDFFRLKDTDPYVAIVWSFGNNMRDYLYSRQIEPLKRAIHFAMFYGDYEPARELGHDLSFIDGIEDMQERYLAVKHYFSRLGHFQQQSFERGQNCRSSESNVKLAWALPSRDGQSPTGNWTARLESAERASWHRWNGGVLFRLGKSNALQNCNIGKPTDGCPIQKKRPAAPVSRAATRPATDCSTGNATARCPNGGGGETGSHLPSATTATWRYPKAQLSTATSPTEARMSITRPSLSTMTLSTTGAHSRRSRSSSAATICPPTDSSAFRSSHIALRFRHRLTTRSRSASSYRGIRPPKTRPLVSMTNRDEGSMTNRDEGSIFRQTRKPGFGPYY